MKYICIYIMLLHSIAFYSQNTVLSGHVIDEEKQDVAGATIQCFVQDTLFLGGSVSNSNGLFSISVPTFSTDYKLIVKYLGYTDNVLFLKGSAKNVQLGNIVLLNSAKQLDEVVVTGSQVARTADKVLYFPSKEQLRHASDGYNALALMMIPALDVDPFTKKVSTIQGETLLCINGREASSDEIRNLNPKDILRIDFYDQHHPEHPNATSVIDYILEHHDAGGSAVLNGQQHLNKGNGIYGVTAQFYKKKSEFTASVSDDYNNYTPKRSSESTTYFKFPEGTVINEAMSLPSPQNQNAINSYFNYLYQDKKNQFYVTLLLNQDKSDRENLSLQTYSNEPVQYKVKDNSSGHILNPALMLDYARTMKHDQKIRLRLSSSYNKNKYDRSYAALQDEEMTSAYHTRAREKNYMIAPLLMYTKALRKSDVLFATLQYNHTYTHAQYIIDGQLSNDYLTDGKGTFMFGYALRLKNKLKMTLQWADQLTYIDNEKESTLRHFFNPGLFTTYMINPKNSIRFVAKMGAGDPGLKYRSMTEQRIDKYQIRKGNPDIKTLKFYEIDLIYSLNTKSFDFAYSTILEVTTDNIPYERVSYDEERNLFVHDYAVGGSGYDFETGPRVKLKIIPGKLTFDLAGYYTRRSLHAWKNFTVNSFNASAKLLFMYKNISASAQVASPQKSFTDVSVFYHTPLTYNFNVGYSLNNWHFEFSARNPFSTFVEKREYVSDIYSSYSRNYGPKMNDHVFYVNVSYRFNWGKKHTFNQIEMEKTRNSAILKANE